MNDADLQAVHVTLRLAAVSTAVLLVIGTPLAWWLARTRSRWEAAVSAVVALPLVLPPTVIGFYMLVALGPDGAVGHLTQALGLGTLPFTFWGLVVGSCVYSLPFVVQPLRAAFEAVPQGLLDAAATLRAGPWDQFQHVALPLARPGLLAAGVIGFAHTVGEFGVVLMLGGNVAGSTRVLSVAVYDHVEALDYPSAHRLAAVLLGASFALLLGLYAWQRTRRNPL
jgi:molybdate transport system permease protein